MIDWKAIQNLLGTNELVGGVNEHTCDDGTTCNGSCIVDIEGMIHELCHAYDCIGNEAFGYIGLQTRVANLIRNKYQRKWYADLSEVRVTTLTFLVMQKLCDTNLEDMLHNMNVNIRGTSFAIENPPDQTHLMFLNYLKSRKLKQSANKIRNFLLRYETI